MWEVAGIFVLYCYIDQIKDFMIHDLFYHLKLKHKLTKKDFKLMLEAYRRFMMFTKNEGLEWVWIGFGTPSMYNNKTFFLPVSGEAPRINSWYRLTPKGFEILNDFLKENPLPKTDKEKDNLNLELFAY